MMHFFQPLNIEETDLNPFTLFGSQWAALTAMANGKVNAMTISWGSIGELWNKHTASIYVRDSRYTKELLDASDVFSLTFFDAKYKNTLKYLGAASGHNEDKIKSAKLSVNIEKEVPFIDQGQFIILCRKLAVIPMPEDCIDEEIVKQFYFKGDPHSMYVGEIIHMAVR